VAAPDEGEADHGCAMCPFESEEDLDRFVSESREAMVELGLTEAAAAFGEVQATAHTTRSEWLGNLGATVRRIKSGFTLPSELQAQLDRIMAEVHRVWPRL